MNLRFLGFAMIAFRWITIDFSFHREVTALVDDTSAISRKVKDISMPPMRSFRPLAIICLLHCAVAAIAQSVIPSVRIIQSVDEHKLITLSGNTHPFAIAKNDRGRTAPDLPMTDLILVLSRAPEQQAAFDAMVASQYDPNSPNFHHWLTPEQVGEDYGVSHADLVTVSNWLTGHGFSVGEIAKDRMSIRFSGTAAQVENTFHTEIHALEVKGVQHIGNVSDPQIPVALAPVVVGVKSLHNFFARPLFRSGSKVIRDHATGNWQRIDYGAANSAGNSRKPRPQLGVSVPAGADTSAYRVEDVTPYDFAAIYNVLPLWTARSPIDGTGQTIAIAGTSAIVPGDVTTFRSAFGLPAYSANQFTMVSGNGQPLTVCTSSDPNASCGINDLTENSLDVEWAGSIAKGSNIVLVASYPSSASDDNLYDSESYIVNKNLASIMTVSYGACELLNGTAGNVEYYNLWQTASSQGIAVFVSTGDGGSASCDDGGDSSGNPYSAQFGLSVNGLASTPFNTAVGGTDFNWCSMTSPTECTASPYWNSTNAANGSSAIGYVPEVPWNDTCASPLATGYLAGWANGIGIGNVSDSESACNFVYNNWSSIYQDSGGSSGGVNLAYYVDTVGGGGGASGCVVNDGVSVASCASSIVSTGAGSGSLTLVKDGWPKPSWQTGVAGIPNDGVRDLPDVSFFSSDGFLSNSSYLICVSANGSCIASSAAGYPNITAEPTAQEVGGTSVASPAMAGVMALINQKAGTAQGSPNTELYKLASKQSYSGCSAESVTAGSTACYFNDIDTNSNVVPCDYGGTEGDPSQPGIQSPNCTALGATDLIGILPGYSAGVGYDQATGLGSLNVANVVSGWPTANGSGTAEVTVTPDQTTLNAGSTLNVPVTVTSSPSGGATPTGTVSLSSGSYGSTAQTLVSGAYTFLIPANSLTAGSDILTVSYSGDTKYASASGTATVSVTSGTSSATFTLSATTPTAVAPGTSASSTITVATTNGYVGTATLACSLTTSTPSTATHTPSCSIVSPTVTLSSASTSGTATVTVTTTAATTSQLQRGKFPGWMGTGGGGVLALLIFLGMPARRRSWKSMLGAIILMTALSGLSGCGKFFEAPGDSTTSGTTAGTYTFTVTAIGNPQVTSVTTTFVVTVN
jgi:subtilase family serine protease